MRNHPALNTSPEEGRSSPQLSKRNSRCKGPEAGYLVPYQVILFCFSIMWHAGILVPQPGIKPTPPPVEAQSLNRWTTGEVPILFCFEA